MRSKALLDAIAADVRPRGVSDLARELGLPRSTVHGLCRTLADMGVLARVNSTEYVIGPQVLRWANGFERQNSIVRVFTALVEGGERREALNLSVLIGRDVMYIACRPGDDPLAVRFREGLRFPAAYTATGKAILSTLPKPEVTSLMSGGWPEPPAPNSVRTLDALQRELHATRERGYSVDNGQLRPSLYSCGAAVFVAGSAFRAAAGVSVAMPSDDVTEAALRRTGEEIASFASEFSRRLGVGIT